MAPVKDGETARTMIRKELDSQQDEPDPTVLARRALLKMTEQQRDEVLQHGADSIAIEIEETRADRRRFRIASPEQIERGRAVLDDHPDAEV
jgi:hypothetical protein